LPSYRIFLRPKIYKIIELKPFGSRAGKPLRAIKLTIIINHSYKIKPMKTLITYYSRTGITKKVSESVAAGLNGELDEIADGKNRKGVVGYLLCGKEAMQKNLPEIEFKKDPAGYDLVIIGTPIWGWNMCSLIRSYLEKNKGKIKKAAFFATMGGSGDDKAFAAMSEIIGKKPVATLGLKTEEVAKGQSEEEIKKFIVECAK